MTVFITRSWKKRLEQVGGKLAILLAYLFTLNVALAGSIEPQSASLSPDEQGMALTATFAIKLGARLEEAIERGVSLHFRLEFILSRKRWYVYDEHVAGRVVDYKLSYQALTRQYRLTQGNQQQNFDSLDETLKALSRINHLPVAARAALNAGEPHRAAVRLSLDHEKLPKPLQVDALADRDWRVEAKTLQWDFTPSATGK